MSVDKTTYLTDAQKKEMGYRIRLVRTMKKMSISELAKEVKMTETELQQTENSNFEFYGDYPDYVS